MTKTAPEIDELRELYRQELQRPGTEECPDDERLASLALGEIEGDERDRLADHVVQCSACAESTRLLMELHREARTRRPRSLWSSNLVRFLAAAVVLVALGVLLRGTPLWNAPGDVERGTGVTTTPEDGAELTSPPRRLTWPRQTGASSYRVRLYDSTANLLWESEIGDRPAIELPTSVADDLESGSSYFWTVELDGAREAGRLGPFWFRLTDER